MNNKTAIVAGATGAVGKALIYQLIEDPSYIKIKALVRRPITIRHHKLETMVIDYDNPVTFKDKLEADDVFCCLGTTIRDAGSRDAFKRVDHEYVLSLADSALKQGARQFIMVSAMGADPKSAVFYNRVKGETEKDVAALGYDTFIAVRPSLLLTRRVKFRLMETIASVLMKITRFLFVGSLKKYRAIEVEKVARAMRYYAASELKGNHVILNDRLFIRED